MTQKAAEAALSGRRALAACLILVSGLGLSACSTPGEPATPASSPSPVETAEPLEYAPLRGTPVDSTSNDHPSLAAKIDNHPAARPQYGLEETDIVFEELVEGGLTRYVALWHSMIPETIGPVRSIRPMDPDILSPMGGIVAYSGGQPRFVAAMLDTPVYNAIHEAPDTLPTFSRTPDRAAPHNVVVAARSLVQLHEELEPPAGQFVYANDAAGATAESGPPTSRVDTSFSRESAQSWLFDLSTGVYFRFQNGVADVDGSGDQLRTTNVVALRVQVDDRTDVPRTELVDSGEAWVSTGGRTIEATWSKTDTEAPVRLTTASGASILLAPGNTWVELVPARTGNVTIVPG